MSISDDWSVPCYGDDAEFEPAPDELDAMYKQLEAGEVLEIGWKCAGRRPPTPIKVVTETKEKTKAKKYVKSDFFLDVLKEARVKNTHTTIIHIQPPFRSYFLQRHQRFGIRF